MSKMSEAELRRRLELLAGVQPSAQATSRVLERVRQTLVQKESLQARKSFWRIIMDNRWSKPAVAAAVILAVAIGLNLIGGRHMGGVAWSQLLENVQLRLGPAGGRIRVRRVSLAGLRHEARRLQRRQARFPVVHIP